MKWNRLASVACTSLALGLALMTAPAAAQSAHVVVPADTVQWGPPPSVPPAIEQPAGHTVYLRGRASGTQNFICQATATGLAWRFIGPQATLFQSYAGDIVRQITTHFLSANPSENGLPRPTWQHSLDSSQVWARVLASSSDPAYVEPGAIPWLLLEVAGSAVGTAGRAALGQTSFIQRVNTSGGIAPATGCSQSSEIGTMALVPYAANYFFFRPDASR